jgi:hypothetical protein
VVSVPVHYYKRGDTSPPYRDQLVDGTIALDLTGATARLLMKKPDGASFNQALTIENQAAATGWVNRPWQTGELSLTGTYWYEVEVTWPGGTKQTFPPKNYGLIYVEDGLG